MILEFADGSSIEVSAIRGGPKLIFGVMRDTLNIEISQSHNSFDDLKELFKDTNKTTLLYTYDEDTNMKVEIGQGYKIFVSISDEIREIPHDPGKLAPIIVEEIYIISLAQITYQESLLEEATGSPNIYQFNE